MTKPKSCSVCRIAMLAGTSFDDAMKLCFEEEPEDLSMNLDAMERALNQAGLKTARLEKTPEAPTSNLLIECRHRKEHFWHYIVYDAERQAFLDPIPNPPKVEEYQFFRAIMLQYS